MPGSPEFVPAVAVRGAAARGGRDAAMPEEPFDLLFKIIVIGDTDTGKSCLMHQFVERRHDKNSSHTVGVEFGSRTIQARARAWVARRPDRAWARRASQR